VIRLLVTTPRGSGGALKHLRSVLWRIQRDRPEWRVELHAPAELLRAAFGRDDQPWMVPVVSGRYSGRLKWELVDLPFEADRVPRTLVYSPFGPLLNVAMARRAVWASRNIIPLLPPETWEMEDKDRLRVMALRYLVALGARVAARTICVSDYSRGLLTQLAGVTGETIRTIPHGVDPVDLDVRCSDPAHEAIRGTPYVVTVGQPTPYRRTRELILGYARLAQRRKDLPRLVMVGGARSVDHAYGEECLRLAEPMLRDGRIVYLGQVPQGDAIALAARAHVVAYPSVHEDCPNAVLEGLAAGRVILCADIPATRELAEASAVFVRDPDPERIESALERAVYDEPLRRSLQAGALARARLFTWDRTAARTIQVLEEAYETMTSP
jgi:glycosyltransferase involved in cell wall biosynthesis